MIFPLPLKKIEQSTAVHMCNPCIWEAEAGRLSLMPACVSCVGELVSEKT